MFRRPRRASEPVDPQLEQRMREQDWAFTETDLQAMAAHVRSTNSRTRTLTGRATRTLPGLGPVSLMDSPNGWILLRERTALVVGDMATIKRYIRQQQGFPDPPEEA